ncbi:putative bifunctional diguanylate cyclase/phosphodiesterase [Radicibacter daui]|uniref:putative bifunctional diguanylate cyclase/phosphodiesterase n=1 Tax=Radicibacter daui TaxID=3064829 RepID=UPI004046C163
MASLAWSARQTDTASIARETHLLSLAFTDLPAKIAQDEESLAISDDMVRALNAGYVGWVDSRVSSWMRGYINLDATFILSPEGEPVYANIDEKVAPPATFEAVRQAATPLEQKLRAAMASTEAPQVTPPLRTVGEYDFAVIDGRPAIVSVKPFITDDAAGSGRLLHAFMLVGVGYLDDRFLERMAERYELAGLSFSSAPMESDEVASLVLKNARGDALGHFHWNPTMPGATQYRMQRPVLLTLVLIGNALVFFGMCAWGRLRRKHFQKEQRLLAAATHDELTGLLNRTGINRVIDTRLAETLGSGFSFALVTIDLDRFKQVNDLLGHAAGDDLIRNYAARLQGLIRSGDSLARIGANSFLICLASARRPQDAEQFCERVLAATRKPFRIDEREIFATASAGFVMAPLHGTDRDELAHRGETALLQAKSEGRDRYCGFSNSMDRRARERSQLEADLRIALASPGQISVLYQPVYKALSGEIAGAEALARWTHPQRGAISPELFIPIAEETGLIHELGEFVLLEACRAARRWPGKVIAVNASAAEIRCPSYAQRVLATLAMTGLEPQQLEIEITETALFDETGQCQKTVEALREAGIHVALDDFGTGFSSLGHLQKFKVDRIKIDRRFIFGVDRPTNDQAIVEAIVRLAQTTNLKTTAEGVETEQQADYLRGIGCTDLQGYLLGRPISGPEVELLVALEHGHDSLDRRAPDTGAA